MSVALEAVAAFERLGRRMKPGERFECAPDEAAELLADRLAVPAGFVLAADPRPSRGCFKMRAPR